MATKLKATQIQAKFRTHRRRNQAFLRFFFCPFGSRRQQRLEYLESAESSQWQLSQRGLLNRVDTRLRPDPGRCASLDPLCRPPASSASGCLKSSAELCDLFCNGAALLHNHATSIVNGKHKVTSTRRCVTNLERSVIPVCCLCCVPRAVVRRVGWWEVQALRSDCPHLSPGCWGDGGCLILPHIRSSWGQEPDGARTKACEPYSGSAFGASYLLDMRKNVQNVLYALGESSGNQEFTPITQG